jgi:hypothetical protein
MATATPPTVVEMKPPTAIDQSIFNQPHRPAVFLAGSIEMGKAEDWQTMVTRQLESHQINCTVFNPRRDSWDASWVQDISNSHFREQVEWELLAQEKCDLILMNFVANTQSPITLLEFGLFAQSSKIIVCCPPGFWRRGNIQVIESLYSLTEISQRHHKISLILTDVFSFSGHVQVVCARYNIPLVDSTEELIELGKARLQHMLSSNK